MPTTLKHVSDSEVLGFAARNLPETEAGFVFLVATLYNLNPTSHRMQGRGPLATLYNAFAQEKENEIKKG